MSRTHRRIHPATSTWMFRVDINPLTLEPYENTPRWDRRIAKAKQRRDGSGYGERYSKLTWDQRTGVSCLNDRTIVFGRKRNFVNFAQRQQRIANKAMCRVGVEDYFDMLEDQGILFDYRGEEIDDNFYDYDDSLPDWWYDPNRDLDYPACAAVEDDPYDDQYYYDPYEDDYFY